MKKILVTERTLVAQEITAKCDNIISLFNPFIPLFDALPLNRQINIDEIKNIVLWGKGLDTIKEEIISDNRNKLSKIITDEGTLNKLASETKTDYPFFDVAGVTFTMSDLYAGSQDSFKYLQLIDNKLILTPEMEEKIKEDVSYFITDDKEIQMFEALKKAEIALTEFVNMTKFSNGHFQMIFDFENGVCVSRNSENYNYSAIK